MDLLLASLCSDLEELLNYGEIVVARCDAIGHARIAGSGMLFVLAVALAPTVPHSSSSGFFRHRGRGMRGVAMASVILGSLRSDLDGLLHYGESGLWSLLSTPCSVSSL